MTEEYFPFDAGAGSDTRESQWRKMARNFRGTGVFNGLLNSLECYADSSGMQVKVKSGGAWVDGFYYGSDAEQILSIATAHASYGRIDRVVVRLDVVNNTVSVAVVTGTPSGSPAVPALTQIATGIWETPIAKVTVDAGVVSIAAAKVTDERVYSYASTSGNLGAADYDSNWFSVAYSNSYTKAHSLTVTPRLLVVLHSAVASPGASDELVRVTVVADGTIGYGDVAGSDATNILISTGSHTGVGTCANKRRASAAGYYRVQAWK